VRLRRDFNPCRKTRVRIPNGIWHTDVFPLLPFKGLYHLSHNTYAHSAWTVAAEANDTSKSARRHWAWADLMRRASDIDVLACPRCGGRLRLIATVEDPDAIRAILIAGTRSRALADRAPPFAPALNTSHAAAIVV
jgi:hypothetical protein